MRPQKITFGDMRDMGVRGVLVYCWPWMQCSADRGLPTAYSYLIFAKHSFRRSSSERSCVSMASCNASVPLLDNSAEAFCPDSASNLGLLA
jgi:hypothetical protein